MLEILRGKRKTKENIVGANQEIASKLKNAARKTTEGPLGLRDHINTILYQEYKYTLIKRFRRKEFFKSIFFWFILALLIGSISGVGGIIYILSDDPGPNSAAMVSAIIGLVTTLLGLPLIIAKYLFNKDEDKYITEQMFSMQDSDRKEREKEREAKALAQQAQQLEKKEDMSTVLKAQPQPAKTPQDTPEAKKEKQPVMEKIIQRAQRGKLPTAEDEKK